MLIDILRKWQLEYVPADRIEHMERTAELAQELAFLHHLDAQKAYLAGLAHDIAKDKHDTELLRIANEQDLINFQEEKQAPFLLHGQVGAHILKEELKCTDNDILFTIFWHTTGHYEFKDWAWATFLADKLEPKKIEADNDLEPFLLTAKKSLMTAVNQFITWRINLRKQKKAIIHPMSALVLEKNK
ncbi:MAG: bis(5'-nucleosyl)-tetraphosphatase (symmetrical) YqeK [Dehalococcoidia bacterium]|nr:bis(5'-nucleosyl)-tetraphosphatase (symmetrical) YqeK [Dehalococcoidia bacterium]